MSLYKGSQKINPIITLADFEGQSKSESLTNKNGQTFTPDSGYDGLTSITVTPNNENRTVTPTTSQQTLSINNGYSGNGTITVNAVTSSIDANISATNIKKNVTILGVTGNYEGSSSTLTTKNITENGTYNASSDNADGYSSVTVNVSGGGGTGINREVVNGVYKAPTTSFTWSLPSGATNIGDYAMYYVFRDCTGLTSVDLSGLTTVSGSYAMYYAFYVCTGLTSVDLSSLTTVSGNYAMYYAFNGCTGLTGALDLSNLTTVSGISAMQDAFRGCTGLTSVDLSGLTTVSGNSAMQDAFRGCTGLTSVDLSSLTTISGSNAMQYAFRDCTGLTGALDLSNLTTVSGGNAMQYAFSGCTGLTSVDLSGLTTVSGSYAMYYAFTVCTGLTSVDLSGLTTIGTNSSNTNFGHFSFCFQNCNALTSLTFSNLEKIYCTGGTSAIYGTFANNNKVQKMYFPKLDTITYGSGASTTNQNACKNIFYSCSALTELHFGAANQAAIEASSGYSTAWGRGAGNVTIYFDL